MPSLLTRLTSGTTYPIVLAQYKNEFRGVGHEPALHWVLVVITDKATLSGPSFHAYAQTSRARRHELDTDVDVQWYTRHAHASLLDVCATVRTLCLGGVQVGTIKAADLEKLVEYLRSHPPVPSTPGWCSRDYVLELLELL
ncbi:hypothetical protein C2E23DRAFT_692443, partial [Lenzites betulinus]